MHIHDVRNRLQGRRNQNCERICNRLVGNDARDKVLGGKAKTYIAGTDGLDRLPRGFLDVVAGVADALCQFGFNASVAEAVRGVVQGGVVGFQHGLDAAADFVLVLDELVARGTAGSIHTLQRTSLFRVG